MRNKKSVLKILSANSECFRVSAGIAPNTPITEENATDLHWCMVDILKEVIGLSDLERQIFKPIENQAS